MSESNPGRLSRIGATLTRIRLFVSNLFFFGFLLVFVFLLLGGGEGIDVPEGGALILNPAGSVVERRSLADPFERLLSPGGADAETELEAILESIERARDDDRIKLLVLALDQLQQVSTAHADAIGDALAAFREGGKEVIAYGSGFAQQPYLIASAADTVFLHPLGQVMLPGYRIENLYYQELLEQLKVNIHVFRAGQYKEFVEPFTRSDMSPQAREVNASLVGELWTHYGGKVVQRRHLDPARFERYSQFLDQALDETHGDLARLALEYQLVDELLTPDQARLRIGEKVGFDEEGEIRGVGFSEYLRATTQEPHGGDAGTIGVITAEGPIVMNGSLDGMIAADALIDLLRGVRQDKDIDALVLRVDSPGGSSFASELIREELELIQLAGKPVVVSMGPVAASGGYWISATADAIVAEPTTLTGSIGVFGIVPSFEDSLGHLGIRADGVATSSVGDVSPMSGLTEGISRVMQATTDSVYERFVNLVARGRDLPPETVEELAQGRVWLGATAADRGLVDQLGDRRAAIAKAAELAKIDTWDVREIEPPVSAGQLLLDQLANTVLGPDRAQSERSALSDLLRGAKADWLLLDMLTDPQHQYALCGACVGGGQSGYW
jgi:protease-4